MTTQEAFVEEDYYDVLNIPKHATTDEVERAYKLAYQTFNSNSLATYSLFSDEENDAILRKITRAYMTLKDPVTRSRYDEELHCGSSAYTKPEPAHASEQENLESPAFEDFKQSPMSSVPIQQTEANLDPPQSIYNASPHPLFPPQSIKPADGPVSSGETHLDQIPLPATSIAPSTSPGTASETMEETPIFIVKSMRKPETPTPTSETRREPETPIPASEKIPQQSETPVLSTDKPTSLPEPAQPQSAYEMSQLQANERNRNRKLLMYKNRASKEKAQEFLESIGMFTGEILQHIRELKAIAIEEVAKETCVRQVYLEALEQDDLSQLPSAPIYLKSFLKSYARCLELPIDKVTDDYLSRFKNLK